MFCWRLKISAPPKHYLVSRQWRFWQSLCEPSEQGGCSSLHIAWNIKQVRPFNAVLKFLYFGLSAFLRDQFGEFFQEFACFRTIMQNKLILNWNENDQQISFFSWSLRIPIAIVLQNKRKQPIFPDWDEPLEPLLTPTRMKWSLCPATFHMTSTRSIQPGPPRSTI